MTGYRHFKSASLRLCVPLGLEADDPEETARMREGIREIIDVRSESRGKGHATKLLHNVCTEADVDRKVLMLQVKKFDEGMDEDKLLKFYSRFGFTTIQTEPVTLMARQNDR